MEIKMIDDEMENMLRGKKISGLQGSRATKVQLYSGFTPDVFRRFRYTYVNYLDVPRVHK